MEGSNYINVNTMRDYLRIIFTRYSIIISVFLIMMITVFIGLELDTPTYEAKVKMLILATKHIESPYYKDISSPHYTEMTSTQSEIVKSNPVIERVVRVLRLSERPLDYEKSFCSPLKSIIVDLQLKMLSAKLNRLSANMKEQLMLRKAVSDLRKRIKVEPVKDTSLFTITVTDYSPETAAKIANAVSRSYVIFDLEQQLSEIELQYGEKHISVMQLKDSIATIRTNLTHDTIPNLDAIGPASVKIIDQASITSEPTGVRKILVLLVAVIFSLILGLVLAFWVDFFDSTIRTPQDVSSLGMQLLGYVPRRTTLRSGFLLLIRNVFTTVCVSLCFLIILRILVDMASSDLQNPLIKFIYAFTKPLLSLSIKFLPITQKLNTNIFLALILFFALCVNALSFKLFSALVRKLNKGNLTVKPRQNGFMQSNKNLAQQIYASMREKKQKVILITSVLPSQDNAAIIANFGAYLSKAGHSSLIIDGNLKNPSLHTIFNVDNDKGLRDVLSRKITFQEAIREVESGVCVMPAGSAAAETLSPLDSSLIEEVVKAARGKFELIFISSADLKNSGEPLMFSSFVDGIIFILNQGKVRKKVFEAVIEPLEKKKSDFLGIILNDRTFTIPKLIYERI